MPQFSLCCSYYRQPSMLARQLAEWEQYPQGVNIICVDDGSPEPARDVLAAASEQLKPRLRLYRITIDKPWHRAGARNLSADKCASDWLCMIDLDHVLPAAAAARLIEYEPSPDFWYKFRRWRVGKADETRMKDVIDRDVEFGEIKSHIDSYFITREMYWKTQGYDEIFAGCLGGGTEFLRRLGKSYGEALMLPADVMLHVHTRHSISDASITTLSRDTKRGKEIARHKEATHAKNIRPLQFPWVREL